MASFNPGVKETNDPSYLNQAKELTGRDFPNTAQDIFQSDKQNFLETLFTGVKGAVDTADNAIKEGIKDAVYGGVDPIRDAMGVGDEVARVTAEAGDAANNPLAANRPPDPNLYQTNIARLQAAYDQGKITDRNYYAQLETLTRSIRSRFPGYREEVDAMVHSVTGITPANALRASIENELAKNAEAKDTSSKDWDRYERSADVKYFQPDYFKRKAEGNPYSQEETKAYIAAQKQQEYAVDQKKAGLELASKEGSVTKEQATQVASEVAAKTVTDVEKQAYSLIKQIADATKDGKPLPPEMENAVRAEVLRLKSMAQASLETEFGKPLSPGSSRTFNGIVDKSDKDKILKDSMKSIELLDQALTDKNYGVFNLKSRELETIQTSAQLDLHKKYPYLAAGAELTKAAGPQGAALLKILMDTPQTGIMEGMTKDTQNFFHALQVTNASGGKFTPSGKTTVDEQLKDLSQFPQGKSPKAVKGYVGMWQNLLTNPEVPTQNKAEAAKILFAQDNERFLEKFVPGDRLQVFQQLTSPAVTKEMIKIKDSDPTTFEKYTKWALNGFLTVSRSAGQNVGGAPDARYWDVKFNPSSAKFEVAPSPEGIRLVNSKAAMARGTMSAMEMLARLTGTDVQSNVDKINAGITTLKPILEANGLKPGEEIQKLPGIMTQYDQKNQNWWQWLMQKTEPSGPTTKKEEQTFGGVHPNFTQASGDNPRGLLSLNEKEPDSALEALKGSFSKGESGDNYNRLVSGGPAKEANLTSMSVKDVLAYQSGMRDRGHLSSAAGKYQIIKGTLQSLVNEGVVTLEDKYDENTQEKLAEALLERRGLSKFLEGKIPLGSFLNNLGDEWEILKKSPEAYHKTMAALMELKRTKLASN